MRYSFGHTTLDLAVVHWNAHIYIIVYIYETLTSGSQLFTIQYNCAYALCLHVFGMILFDKYANALWPNRSVLCLFALSPSNGLLFLLYFFFVNAFSVTYTRAQVPIEGIERATCWILAGRWGYFNAKHMHIAQFYSLVEFTWTKFENKCARLMLLYLEAFVFLVISDTHDQLSSCVAFVVVT